MKVKEYWKENTDEGGSAYFSIPDYDYVTGLEIEYYEDDDIYVAMGNESWNESEYDGDTDMKSIIADFSNAWRKETEKVCGWYDDIEWDKEVYANDDYDTYIILLNEGERCGLCVEECYCPYKGSFVRVVNNKE